MSLLPNQTNVNQDTYFFLLVDSKVITTSTITANTGLYDKLYVNSISTGSIVLDNISTLTANISSINTNYISSGNAYISSLVADNINVSSITAQTGFISSLDTTNIRVSTITADTFNTNTISSGLGFISSFSGNNITTSSIIGQSGFFSSFATRFLSSGIATVADFIVSSINFSSISQYQASNWWLYEAQGDIKAKTNPTPTFPLYIPSRQYDLLGVRNIQATNINLSIDPFVGGVLNAVAVGATTGNIGTVNTEDIEVSATNETGDVNIYGANKLPGDNALYVEGGTTLTGGGIIHGVTIGALQAGGIDTVRIDVLPAGMLLTSATFLTATAVGATAVTAGGALSLAGGSYIEYNSDQHYFKNTTSGNDFTDIYVGNIYPAFGGSANLRINGGGQGQRGVELATVKSIDLYSQNLTPFWDSSVTYAPGALVNYNNNVYSAVVSNLNVAPGINPIPLWVAGTTYYPYNYASWEFSGPPADTYRCFVQTSGSIPPPGELGFTWLPFVSGSDAVSNIWTLVGPEVVTPSYLIGDSNSFIRIGALSTNSISSGFILADTIGANLLFGTSTIADYIELLSGGNPSGIVGDSNSYIRVGSGLFDNIITSTINVSTINAFNISSFTVDNLTATTLTVDNIVSNPLITDNINISAGLNTTLTSQVDTIITGTQNLTLQSSNLNIIGSNFISGVGNWNYNNYNLFDIGHLTAVSTSISYISTGTVWAEEVYTNTLITSNIGQYSGGDIRINDNFDFQGFNIKNVANINCLSTNVSTIITNNVTVRGDTPLISFYGLEDQELPFGILTVAGSDFNIIAPSTIQILSAVGDIGLQAPNGSAIIEASNIVTLKGDFEVQLQTPFIRADTYGFISTIATNNILSASSNSNIDIEANIVNISSVLNVGKTTITPALSTIRISTSAIRAEDIIVNDNLTVLGGINTINTVSVGLRVSSITSYYPAPTNTIPIDGILDLRENSLFNGSLSTTSISTGSLFVNNYRGDSISTNRISTGSLFSGAVSTLQVNTSSITTNRATITNLTGPGSGTFTTNLFPQSAGAQIGFFGGAGTNSGGFYNNINVRSTNTQVLVPDVVGAFSNNIRVQGNLSTQNVFVSSINNKLYPYTSTLNIPFSSFSITGNQAGTPILLYSNVDFRTQGFHRISQKTILSKNSGGASADIHGNIFYTVGAFPSTPSITDGYSALPFVNQDNASTFTTLMTEFYVSTPTTRNILYYDATANNYTARLYMGTLFDTYTPQFGLNPERIPANIL